MEAEQQTNWAARKSSLSTAVEPVHLLSRYQWEVRLGSGSFGDVYRCLDTTTSISIAVKVEKKSGKSVQLLHESEIIKCVSEFPGFPRFVFYHEDADNRYLGMTLLGESLEDLFRRKRSLFTYKFVLKIGLDLIMRLRDLHSVGYISRDVKSENILMSDTGMFNLIDFGLAKLIIDPQTRKHIPLRVKNTLTGTARYASLNAHRGMELSRRDDLESLGYVLLYLLRGTLPWQGLRTDAVKTDKYQMIFELKRKVDIDFICRDLPDEVCFLILYARALDFTEKPDYAMLIDKFHHAVDNCPTFRPRKQSEDVQKLTSEADGNRQRRMSMPVTIVRGPTADTKDDTIAALSSRRVADEEEVSVKSKPLANIVETSLSSGHQEQLRNPTTLNRCFRGIFRCGRFAKAN